MLTNDPTVAYTDREREELSVHPEVRDLVEARETRDRGETQV